MEKQLIYLNSFEGVSEFPPDFCISAAAYQLFVRESGIDRYIAIELERKPAEEMRWEELWDSALRIRSQFMSQDFPDNVSEVILAAWNAIDHKPVAVRSSAIDEDKARHSFAGLHESILNVSSEAALLDAVRIVWASLWSDAALLYRAELGLCPSRSSMAVLVQQMIDADCSGVAFAADPREARSHVAIVEAVDGPCSLLVDGMKDPDHWEIDRASHKVLTWTSGQEVENSTAIPLLDTKELGSLLELLTRVEELCDWTPDIEWTGRSEALYLLQARPITTVCPKKENRTENKRAWYLSLRPRDAELQRLRERVTLELIPELKEEGERLSKEALELLDDNELANAIAERSFLLEKWKTIYWDDFIPFAHGVRRLAIYYNDVICPNDPYEFVQLLVNEPMLASKRNSALRELASHLTSDGELRRAVVTLLDEHLGRLTMEHVHTALFEVPKGPEFATAVEAIDREFFDISYEGARLCEDLRSILNTANELSQSDFLKKHAKDSQRPVDLNQRFLKAVGAEREDEAAEILETARISWALRDDDNLLLSRIESQLTRAVELGAQRLKFQKRLKGDVARSAYHAESIQHALANDETVELVEAPSRSAEPQSTRGVQARQLVGQPASPGLASGLVRLIQGPDDLAGFRAGEILVCDAIQPMMTHVVPLASAVVERRGGMLIHGAIIARELGIPCVNGVKDASEILANGQLVTVDGSLGVVTVGEPNFGQFATC